MKYYLLLWRQKKKADYSRGLAKEIVPSRTP
jgi:hypothetical protein